jgi:hypothetical protein
MLGLTLVEEGDAVVGEGGLELHGLRPSVAAAADSGFVSSAGGEMLSGGGCAAPPCLSDYFGFSRSFGRAWRVRRLQ